MGDKGQKHSYAEVCLPRRHRQAQSRQGKRQTEVLLKVRPEIVGNFSLG